MPISARLGRGLGRHSSRGNRCTEAHGSRRLPSRPPRRPNRTFTKGKGAAQHLVLRHRLAEKLLTDVIGLEWSRAHEEAERLEHGISAEVAHLLIKRFGRESRCPHGVPLFGGMSRLRRKHGAVRLSEAPSGQLLRGSARLRKGSRNFSNFSTTFTCGPPRVFMSTSASTTKPWPSPSQAAEGAHPSRQARHAAHLGPPASPK